MDEYKNMSAHQQAIVRRKRIAKKIAEDIVRRIDLFPEHIDSAKNSGMIAHIIGELNDIQNLLKTVTS